MKFNSDHIGLHEGHFVSKGWGYESWIWNSDKYCGKILFFKQNKMCSWHYHLKKDETFYLQDGELQVSYSFNDDITTAKRVTLKPGDVFHVPVGMRHQMVGIRDSHLIEFSTQHFDDDSIRLIRGD